MARVLVPYGLRANGNYGLPLDNSTGQPIASVFEIVSTLPSAASADNFDGRAVFVTSNATPYVFSASGSAWIALEGIPASVGNVAGSPPTVPTPSAGELFWDLDTEVLFVWDGSAWQAAGGRYAATIIENTYIGDNLTVNYPSGSPSAIQSQYVEVFIDGVRQTAGTDYNIVGTNVNFTVAPPNATNILIRALISDAIVQNAQIESAVTTASPGQTDFSTGQAGSDPAGVFVFVDGSVQVLGVDYNLVQQDTTINSFTKTSSTNARATTATAHNIPVGASITLGGFNEPEYNNVTFTVANVPTATSFDVTVLATDPASGTGNPTMFFSPPFVNDIVEFVSGMAGGENVDIRSLRNVVVTGATGEANTLASVGGGFPLPGTKVGSTLQIKSIAAGSNIGIVDSGTQLTISANNGLMFEDRVGINAFVYVPTTESYVGVRNTSAPVAIDLTAILQDPSNSGRRITIADESGGAGVNNITISANPARIDGSLTAYQITTNYGAVTMVMDGTNWVVISEKP